jgi:V-type H+-transporting ATPase subunit E
MEGDVFIRCRKSDLTYVLEVYKQAAEEYKHLMSTEVKVFKGKDVPCKITVESNKHLPEYDETDGAQSCMGGIMLHAKKGRIVCSNTIDERLQLVYQEAIPEIRRMLFPSFNKKPAQVEEDHVKPAHGKQH